MPAFRISSLGVQLTNIINQGENLHRVYVGVTCVVGSSEVAFVDKEELPEL